MTIAGEGGHVTMTPASAQESALLDLMRKRYDHVSAERLLSGPGLVNLYNTLCELAQIPAAPFTPAQIISPHIWDKDPRTREATAIFCAMLGTVAGNLALTLGARGGIYIAGGIVPRLDESESENREASVIVVLMHLWLVVSVRIMLFSSLCPIHALTIRTVHLPERG